MPTTRWGQAVATVRDWWTDLERDWKSVAVGLAVVALVVAADVRIPW